MDKFAVFIISHGRADKIKTVNTLNKQRYTGKYFIVIDNKDDTEEEYRTRYGKKVIQFDKDKIAKESVTGDITGNLRSTIFARNALFGIAKELGIKYFLVLDDDYTNFNFKFSSELDYDERRIQNLDNVFKIMLEFYKKTNALTLCMAQGGDFIGGKYSGYGEEIKITRKAMNSFFCSTDRPFKFLGLLNEDVNTYITLGSRGGLFFTVNNVSLNQTNTQSNKGGMTEIYLELGTYVKSFYSVMFMPSCVKVSMMGDKHKRIHHKIKWNNCVPKILSEKYKRV